ncbi:CPBP family intramembrane glutamic endopeptidase [endosymbiont GvMRE of Glomus versiforme]|uniref:CPBP family intramembrane glutamic endopeptidase n=1 Tax=endosymbiont GvMRE of Glomus versiforme TaxID=2039283 RepID=UPI000EE89440|nr:CAAX protease [endosymbiont GvMRE of Glomus versiforme]
MASIKNNSRKYLIRGFLILFIVLKIKLVVIFKISLLEKILQLPLFLIFSLVCLIGPIIEEFIFRYLIFKYFDKNTWTPYLFSFLSFVLWHFHGGNYLDLLQLFPTHGIAALCFIFIYKETNWNLFFPILLHCLGNFFVLIAKFC